ncbi:AsmA family protein [Flavobacterium sp. NST-5]|uniref:AsmA family protein n=1 Tax=Flavobacterium ichthyis TaxID=2698827 RepID=A0ABW9ZAC0_9FLAO|nr:AsmA-like C-terminal region-containing protein [Flavobacterium ichthyis]NBL65815.1 AsmA family protein [Flavobacterium ichthyis]
MQETLPFKRTISKWLKILLKILAILFVLMVVLYLSMAFYINTNKEKILASVTSQINENIDGKIKIGAMDPTFVQGFPRISLRLRNVEIIDNRWQEHQKTLIKANDFNLSINALAFLFGEVEIRKIEISNAKIHLFTDENGYSNTSVFGKKNNKNQNKESDESFGRIKGFDFKNVQFISQNKKGGKLFDFLIHDFQAKFNFDSQGWESSGKINAFANNMAFNTKHGSFIKSKKISGKLAVISNREKNTLEVLENRLEIGGDKFDISGKFSTDSHAESPFELHIKAPSILWLNAANLLSPNITKQLKRFDLKKEINVRCDIVGDLNVEVDPHILVNAQIKGNQLTIPDGTIKNCSFSGIFSNEYRKGKGFNDPNSAIKIYNFRGDYNEIPVIMDSVIISNLEQPLATGIFKSKFPLIKLNKIIDPNLLHFSSGNANVALDFIADIVDFSITKPYVSGLITVDNASIKYVPRNISFTNTSLALDFTDKDLFIRNLILQTPKSVVKLEGSVKNFLNTYYTDPNKIILQWNIRSPQLELSEFLGFLGSRKKIKNKKTTDNPDVSDKLDFLFEKSSVAININVKKLIYNKFVANDVHADFFVSEKGINIKKMFARNSGGTLNFSGNLLQSQNANKFSLNTNIQKVEIASFFKAFNNFGLESLKAENLEGQLSSTLKITGLIKDNGSLSPKSIYGNLNFQLQKGKLLNFEPIKKTGKFAFPFRDLSNITFSQLNGKLIINGEKVEIAPMKISSSVLNMDVAGTYSFGKGTNILVDVPLRNPKNDRNITNKEKLEERRNRGIVLHLLATDKGSVDGKVNLKLVSKKRGQEAISP